MADNSPAIFTKYTELTSEYDVYGSLIIENGDKYESLFQCFCENKQSI